MTTPQRKETMDKETTVEENIKALTELANRGIQIRKVTYIKYILKSVLLATLGILYSVLLLKIDILLSMAGPILLIGVIANILFFIWTMESWRDMYIAWVQMRNSVALTEQMIKSLSTVNKDE